MKKVLILAGILVALTPAAASAGADKVTLCHATGKPGEYVEISVDDDAVDAHLAHGDYYQGFGWWSEETQQYEAIPCADDPVPGEEEAEVTTSTTTSPSTTTSTNPPTTMTTTSPSSPAESTPTKTDTTASTTPSTTPLSTTPSPATQAKPEVRTELPRTGGNGDLVNIALVLMLAGAWIRAANR